MLSRIYSLCFVLAFSCANAEQVFLDKLAKNKIVIATKQIVLKEFPDAYNPSILKLDLGYLLTFRYSPDHAWQSYIGIVILDDSFNPISKPELLNARSINSHIQSQSEDARIFSYREKHFLIYNDNVEINFPNRWGRRDMFISELLFENNHFELSSPMKMVYEDVYNKEFWQKNWMPFEWNKNLMFIYTPHPHEVLSANLINGSCKQCYQTNINFDWKFGQLRGSTPPQIFDGEFLTFFHSNAPMPSSDYGNKNIAHYFMGAYTFSANPPFQVTKITPFPIVGEGFYDQPNRLNPERKVIFPGGFVATESVIHVAYGKGDTEMWIATLDKKALKNALKPVKANEFLTILFYE